MYHNIVLVGMMGSGKSTIGKQLATQHNLHFIDTDTEIETQTHKKITDIFLSQGENAFRAIETAYCSTLPDKKNHVIATGGGIVLAPENRIYLRQTGYIVYLKATVETLLDRLSKDTSRPLLAGTDKAKKLADLLAQRDTLYQNLAHTVLTVGTQTPEDIGAHIWQHYTRKTQ